MEKRRIPPVAGVHRGIRIVEDVEAAGRPFTSGAVAELPQERSLTAGSPTEQAATAG